MYVCVCVSLRPWMTSFCEVCVVIVVAAFCVYVCMDVYMYLCVRVCIYV